MSLSNYLFQQNQMQQPISALTPKKQNIFDAYSQQIAPKELAGMETRTPTQIAYDNLLNREAEINQQNKRNNFVSGLMSGIGGLGKVIANSVVSNPYQKAGAMEGIGEQETRLDGLRQAYDQARQQQNKDFVAQAREQLGLAREDEDKDYRRSEADKMFQYQIGRDKFNDDITKKNLALSYNKYLDDKERADKDFDLKQQVTEAQLKKIGIETNNLLNPNKAITTKDLIDLENLKKLQRENSPEYIAKQEQEKKEQEENKAVISKADKLLEKKAITPEQYAEMVSDPQKYKDVPLENRNWFTRFWRKVPFTDTNTLRFGTNNDYEIMEDANGNRAKIYKDGRIEEI